ncbi:MAG: DUF2130 domain-containing protein [Rickettsiales bacterium]|jgi:hypothetical protein|nr:DUF2130 domain-containing protein [Rickettsiales bacterium]
MIKKNNEIKCPECNKNISKFIHEYVENELNKAQKDFEQEKASLQSRLDAVYKCSQDMKIKAFPITPQEKGQFGEEVSGALLKQAFPSDIIEAEQKGKEGADIFHIVKNTVGNDCGKILWEVKNTKNWLNEWVEKLKEDKIKSEKVKFAIIVSNKLPNGVKNFAPYKDVWVCSFDYAIPLAHLIREKLIDLMAAESLSNTEKINELHNYLIGSPFRLRIESIVSIFNTLRVDIEKEQREFNTRCKNRIAQLCKIIQTTNDLFSELAGVNIFPKIELFEKALEDAENLQNNE